MEDEHNYNYRLLGDDESKNKDEPTNKDTAYLLNDCSRINTTNVINNIRRNTNNNSSSSDFINNIVNSFEPNNLVSKFVVAALLFHPITNLIIHNNPNVNKIYTKSQRKIIKYILIFFLLLCLIGYSTANTPGKNSFMSFIIKFALITFLLIHTNIFNIINFNETIKLWKKALNKQD